MDEQAVRKVVAVLNGAGPSKVTITLRRDDDEDLRYALSSLTEGIVCGNGRRLRTVITHKSNDHYSVDLDSEFVCIAYALDGVDLCMLVPALPLGEIAAVKKDFPHYRFDSHSHERPPQNLFSSLRSLEFESLMRRYRKYDPSDVIAIVDRGETVEPKSLNEVFSRPVEHSTVDVKCKGKPWFDAQFVTQHAFNGKNGGTIVKMLASVDEGTPGSTVSDHGFFSIGTDRATLFFGVHNTDKQVLGNLIDFDRYSLPQTVFPILLQEDVTMQKIRVDIDHEVPKDAKRWVIEVNEDRDQGKIIELRKGRVWKGKRYRDRKSGMIVNSLTAPDPCDVFGKTLVWAEAQCWQWPVEFFETRHLLKLCVCISDKSLPRGCFLDNSSAFATAPDSWFKHFGVWLRLKDNSKAENSLSRKARRTVYWGIHKPSNLALDLLLDPTSNDQTEFFSSFKGAIQDAHGIPVTVGVEYDFIRHFQEAILDKCYQGNASWVCESLYIVVLFPLDSVVLRTSNSGVTDESYKVMQTLLAFEDVLTKRRCWLTDVLALKNDWIPDEAGIEFHLTSGEASEHLETLIDLFVFVDQSLIVLSPVQLKSRLRDFYLGEDAHPPWDIFCGSWAVWTSQMRSLLDEVKSSLNSRKVKILRVKGSLRGSGVSTALRSVAWHLAKETEGLQVAMLHTVPDPAEFERLADWFTKNVFVIFIDRPLSSGRGTALWDWLSVLQRPGCRGCVVLASDNMSSAIDEPSPIAITPFWTYKELSTLCLYLRKVFVDCSEQVFTDALRAANEPHVDPSNRHFFLFSFAASNGLFKPVNQWIEDAWAEIGRSSNDHERLTSAAKSPGMVFDVLAFVGAICPKDCGVPMRDDVSDPLFQKASVKALLRKVNHQVSMYASDKERWLKNGSKRPASFVSFVHPYFARCYVLKLPHEVDWNGIYNMYGFVKENLLTLLLRVDKEERDYLVEIMFSNGTTFLQRLCTNWRQFKQMAEFLELDEVCQKVAVSELIRRKFHQDINQAVRMAEESLKDELKEIYLLKNNYAMCLKVAWQQSKNDKYFTQALEKFEQLFEAKPGDFEIVQHAYNMCERKNQSLPVDSWPKAEQTWSSRRERLGGITNFEVDIQENGNSLLMWVI